MKRKRRRFAHINFQFTTSRRNDIIRFLVAGLIFFSMVTVYWNQSSTPLKNLAQGYQGYIFNGLHEQKMLDEEGVALIKSWLEEQTSPTLNPVTILRQYQHSKKPTENYELAIGMLPLSEDGIREYAIYQIGQTIYLQVEPMGVDRVLSASFSAKDLESALSPYIKGEFRSTANTSP